MNNAATRIAVCLITCDRSEYTRETVRSFSDMNADAESRRFDRYHFDDASEDYRNGELARSEGFATIYGPDTRLGVTATIRRAIQHCAREGHSHVLILENDWKSVRPFPWELFDYFLDVPVAYTLRLCGQFKEWDDVNNVGRRPFGNDHAGRNKANPMWCPLVDAPEPAEMGCIHFGNPPAVTRLAELRFILDGSRSEKECRAKSGLLEAGRDYTIRPAYNVFFHIGAERTPNFKR